MPRNQGTSRKGKPKKNERAAGMGRALHKAQLTRFRPKSNGSSRGAGMAMAPGTQSLGLVEDVGAHTKSILELDDLTDFLGQAEMANREFESEREQFIVLDPTGTEYHREVEPRVSWADQPPQKTGGFAFSELSVPRRPPWDEHTTPDELDAKEKESFLEWRRAIAGREEVLDGRARVTPFEKNLEVWRQLWRVMERCSCILQIVDARNPLFYLSRDLRKYATEELGKPMLLLVNKSDYLSKKQRQEWHSYLEQEGWDHLFFSAHMEQAKLDAAAASERRRLEELLEEENLGLEDEQEERGEGETKTVETTATVDMSVSLCGNIGVEMPLTREELLDWLNNFAVQYNCEPDARYENRIQFGMVGFPNVGKSSVINVLVGSSKHSHGVVRVAVASQPGKTKHFQTLLLPDRDDIMLCDCPGLVFPSFVSNTADLIAAGVYPIAQMRDHWPVVELICKRIPREILNAQYGIHLPVPTPQELTERGLGTVPPPTAEQLLEQYCVARSLYATASGVPDFQRASRVVIKDYADGKLLYCHAPPPVAEGTSEYLDVSGFQRETILTALNNTKKLREKFSPLLEQSEQGKATQHEGPVDDESDDCGEFDDDLVDILDLVDSQAAAGGEQANGGRRGKAHKSIKKHGRKGRKDRNKDPYGCHTDPDNIVNTSSTSVGLVVNAGKYGKRGYTRPTSYGGARQYESPVANTPSKVK
jgi:large subunit GTPase 1